jgi:SpoVK/Ycf46/Vps4 family AAA+-type ATPase
MNTEKFKTFVEFLDAYNKRDVLSKDYSILLTAINKNYIENNIYDPSLVGFVKIKKNEMKTKKLNISQLDSSINYYNNYSSSIWNISQSSDWKINDPSFNFIINSRSEDCCDWQSPYVLWQKQHEAFVINSLIGLKTTKNKTVFIDASISSLSDIIEIINNNEYSSDTEYNIDIKALHNIKSELITLNGMIGMESMKKAVLDQLIYFVQELHIGKETSDFKHTVIFGPPGTGKTETAKIIGKMYSKLGILKSNFFKKVTRNDLIAGYLGQTAIKTRKVIDECLGGVLFIDEAYSLASGNDNNDSYSKECIDILCEALSDHKNNLMVIIAGYEEELNDTFFRVNRGLQSRFIWRFSMEAYNSKELRAIFKKMVMEQDWNFENEEQINDKWFEDKKDKFTNFGRDMELLLTYVKISHGRRIYGKDKDLRKKISIDDMNQGYKTFIGNKKSEKKDSMHLYGVYV